MREEGVKLEVLDCPGEEMRACLCSAGNSGTEEDEAAASSLLACVSSP